MSSDQLKKLIALTRYCLQAVELRIEELKERKDTLETERELRDNEGEMNSNFDNKQHFIGN